MRHRRPYAWRRQVVPALLIALLASGCVAPAFDEGAYHQNGVAALESALSQTRTAALVLQARMDGDVTGPMADTVVTESEEAIGPIQASYENVDPASSRQDGQRKAVTELLSSAATALTEARIALRRNDTVGMRSAVTELNRVSDDLESAGQPS